MAAQRLFDEAEQAVEQGKLREATEKFNTYLADGNALKQREAKTLLAEIQLVSSENSALDTLIATEKEDFERFQHSRHYDDKRITNAPLVKLWDSRLVAVLPQAIPKWEATHRPVAQVTPGALLTAYANKLAGEQQYTGKVLEVTGFVVYVGNAGKVSLAEFEVFKKADGRAKHKAEYLKAPPPNPDVHDVVKCSFSQSARVTYADINREKITIHGRCTGGSQYHVNLEQCSIVRSFREERLAKERELRAINERAATTVQATKVKDEELRPAMVGNLGLPEESVYGPITSAYDFTPGKVLEVHGHVRSVDKGTMALDNWWSTEPEVNVLKVELDSTFCCYFMPQSEEDVRKLHPGHEVTIRGVVDFGKPDTGAKPFLKFCVLAP
jgi:hypothetical protein